MLDELDARLISLLTAEPRIGVLEASRRLGVARGTVQARLDTPAYAKMKADIQYVGLNDVAAMYDTYSGDKAGLREWLKDAVINRDRDLRLQYLAGLSLNRNLGDPIYQEMLKYKTLPTGLKVIFARPPTGPDSVGAVNP